MDSIISRIESAIQTMKNAQSSPSGIFDLKKPEEGVIGGLKALECCKVEFIVALFLDDPFFDWPS